MASEDDLRKQAEKIKKKLADDAEKAKQKLQKAGK